MTSQLAGPIVLFDIRIRQEGDEWVVGRVDSGTFIAVPEMGAEAVRLLQQGHGPAEVASRLECPSQVIEEFVTDLTALGFVAERDGQPVDTPAPPPVTHPWIAPGHVRWLLSRWTGAVLGLTVLAGVAAVVSRWSRVPAPTDVLWSRHGSLVILSQMAATWISIYLHELGHLLTARAVGVPGRMRLGTRLQFLCAQTDVSGIWSAPQPIRVAVYLAGMAVNAFIAAIAVLYLCFAPAGTSHPFASLVFLTQIGLLAGQLYFFMRTDVYFVAQDLARCRNLYQDAGAYVKHRFRVLTGRSSTDPTASFKTSERRAVRLYAAFFLPGTIVCLVVFGLVTVPILWALLSGAIRHVNDPASVWDLLDGLVVLGNIIGFKVLWARAWWRRHGTRVRARLAGGRR